MFGGEEFAVKTPDNSYLSQVIKLNHSDESCWSRVPQLPYENGSLPQWSFPFEPFPEAYYEKTSDKIPAKGHSVKYWTSAPQNCQGCRNKEDTVTAKWSQREGFQQMIDWTPE